jgi:hypothetical protein
VCRSFNFVSLHSFSNCACLFFLAGDSSVNVSVPPLAPFVPTALSSRVDQLSSPPLRVAFSSVHYGTSSAVLPHLSPSSATGLLSVDSAFQSVVIPDVPYVLGPSCSLVTGYPTPSGKFVSSFAVSAICMARAVVKCVYASSNVVFQYLLYPLLMLSRRWRTVVEGWSFTPSSVKELEVWSSYFLCCFSLLLIF